MYKILKGNINKFVETSKHKLVEIFKKNSSHFSIFKNTISLKPNKSINFKSGLIKKFSEEINQDKEIFKKFEEEFDKTLSMNEDDQEKRVRLLSLKLLKINNSKEVLYLFDEKYIKGLVSHIYGEEVALIIYFYVSLLNREFSDYETNPNKTPRVYGKYS